MKKALRWGWRLVMWLSTAVVVAALLAYVVGQIVGVPIRPTIRTVARVPLIDPAAQKEAPALALDSTSGRQSRPLRAQQDSAAAQNVILLIGDGMGLSMLSTADALRPRRLVVRRMPVTGLVRTASLTGLITDSGAAATAMATGYRTRNGGIGMTPDDQSRPNILEAAQRQGLATGIITTSYLTDATPAGFSAHTRSRQNYGTIARQMVASELDLLLGGRQPVFTDSLRRAARRAGFTVAGTLDSLQAETSRRWLGLFPQRSERLEYVYGPPLQASLAAALQKMQHSNAEGFFLVAEQEATDAAGHANRLGRAVKHTVELDRAVEQALRFAAENGRTLVLVTADHDTGGLSVTAADYGVGVLEASWATFSHTAQWVPLFAYGPGAGRFTGVMENTTLATKMARALGLESFLASEEVVRAVP